jgi:hypothetical protein
VIQHYEICESNDLQNDLLFIPFLGPISSEVVRGDHFDYILSGVAMILAWRTKDNPRFVCFDIDRSN